MPDPRRIRLSPPSRITQPHSGQSLDPTLTRRGKTAHPGSIVLAVAGFAFFAYIFNLGGAKNYLDNFFGGIDTRLHSHNDDVAKFAVLAVPYVALAIGAVILFFVLSMLARSAKSLSPKRTAKAQTKVVQPSTAAAPAVTPAAHEVIKPARLAIRELDMKTKPARHSQEYPAAKDTPPQT